MWFKNKTVSKNQCYNWLKGTLRTELKDSGNSQSTADISYLQGSANSKQYAMAAEWLGKEMRLKIVWSTKIKGKRGSKEQGLV